MSQHRRIEPDFNAVDDEVPPQTARRRQVFIYVGVTLALIALLIFILL